jgi:hypothetical protein
LERGLFSLVSRIIVNVKRTIPILALLAAMARGEAGLVEYLDVHCAFNDAMQTRNEVRASYNRSPCLIDTISGPTVSGS